MGFWIRHLFLLLVCVVLPFGAAVYVDTTSEVQRAERGAALGATLARSALDARLTLLAHDNVSSALNAAQRLLDKDLIGELARTGQRRDAAWKQVVELLDQAAPQGGFAWLVDETGGVVAMSGQGSPEAKARKVSHLPLFLQTQDGFALDGLWREGSLAAIAGAAPLTVKGQASGAVFVGQPLDKALLESIKGSINSDLSLVVDGRVHASTLSERIAAAIMPGAAEASTPVSGGFTETPLQGERLPLVPLFVAKDAHGIAYSSVASAPTGWSGVTFLVSVPTVDALRELGPRQELLLSGLFVFSMLALLIGLMNHRTFVRPIARITDHLSELQMGRGEVELSESAVPSPFRRLVKLINMTVQRIPTRGFSGARVPGADGSPISELPQPSPLRSSSGDLRLDAPSTPDVLQSSTQPPAPRLSSRSTIAPIPQAKTGAEPLASQRPSTQDLRPAAPVVPPPPADRSTEFAPEELLAQGTGLSADEEEARAIAEAIASLEGKPAKPRASSQAKPTPPAGVADGLLGSSTVPPSVKQQRSAADIRGVSLAPERAPARPLGLDSVPAGISAADLLGGDPAFAPPPAAFGAGPDHSLRPLGDAARGLMSSAGGRDPAPARGGGSLDAYGAKDAGQSFVDDGAFNPEATVVAPVQDELLRKSARDEVTDAYRVGELGKPSGDMTMVATVPQNLIAKTVASADDEDAMLDAQGLDAADKSHFKETYERFIEMRKRCGEPTSDLAFDRFLAKLTKNREGLIKKYNCRTVRFQVYEKDGKAALKATPVRAR